MSKDGIRAGAAYVEIATKQGAFDKGVTAVQQSLKRLSAVASTIGGRMGAGFGAAQSALGSLGGGILNVKSALLSTFAVGGLGVFVKSFADATGAVDDMAQRTGMTAEEVTRLAYAAKLSGTDVGVLEKGMRKMGVAVVSAASGANEAQSKFAMLGLDVRQLAAMSPEDQFKTLAEALSRVPNQTQRAAMAMEIFGKSGADLLPMLNGGAEGIQKLTDEATKLGVVMSSEDAQSGAQLGDVLDQLSSVVGGLSTAIGATLAPMLISIGTRITSVIATATEWINANRELITTIIQWIGIGAAVGTAIVGIATAAVGLSVAFGAVGAVVTTIGSIIGGAFTAAAAAVAFLASPIGIVMGLLGGLAAAAIYFSGAGTAAINYFSEQFAALTSVVMPVIDGIKTALMSGQFGEAASLAMLGIELAFRTGLRDLYSLWTTGIARLQNAWTDLNTGIATGMVSAVAGIANTFSGIPTALMNAFSTTITWLTGAWDSTVSYIAKKLLYLYSLFDRSVDYESAAKQMDAESAARAEARQKELDKTTGARNAALMSANRQRLETAAGVNANITSNADSIKQQRLDTAAQNTAAFDNRIEELGTQIASKIESINATAAATAAQGATARAAPAALEMPALAGAQDAVATSTKTGTFSGFAAGLAGNVSSFDKLVDQSKKQLTVLNEIATNTGRNAEETLI